MYEFHHQTSRLVRATPSAVFDELDDHERLSAHMMNSSAMMAGSKMKLRLDEAHGRGVGAKIALEGRVLGIALRVEEIVTEYQPPARKVWETIGEPRLLVIGSYRMGFTVEPQPTGSLLTVFIDHDLPSGLWGVLGRLAGPFYARWCSVNLAKGVARRFA